MTGKLEDALVVIVAGTDGAPRAGRLAGELRTRGARVAVFAAADGEDGEDGLAGDADAIVELVAELGREHQPR